MTQKDSAHAACVIQLLGSLEPDRALVTKACSPDFELGSFDNHVVAPDTFQAFLREKGYAVDFSIDSPTLIASRKGVSTHQDYQLTAVWVLAGGAEGDFRGDLRNGLALPGLVVGQETHVLQTGQVVIFDAWTPHRLMARRNRLWALLSTYIKPLSDDTPR